ncbi:hypothetical protein M408DRAFT_283743 [Serendipita vermifera MAFF 305830]|uniref:Uncharacterized protein n=1 Tax=Serendipita vermifera MAFF 305830 TaxID=933852 RepID=A0A0C3ATA2_SERVB|nr:hypothetical protein M408DRAFT_283743 [Serendipita vermifera MAFF 305830]
MSKVLIIDDTNPEIRYSNGWMVGGSVTNDTNECKSTIHRSDAAGNEISYAFFGTQITVHGTLDAPDTNGPPNATFSIDATTPVVFNSTRTIVLENTALVNSFVPLYQSPDLSKGQHTLTVKTRTLPNPVAAFYFDFFIIATGSNSAPGNVIVDDRDPWVSCVGTWDDHGTIDEYLHTTRLAPDVGGGSATFRFNGNCFTVHNPCPTCTYMQDRNIVDGIWYHGSLYRAIYNWSKYNCSYSI